MIDIRELKNSKTGKDCIIVAGGHSVNEVFFDSIVANNIDIIAVNYIFIKLPVEYIVHYDKEVANFYDEYYNGNGKIISYRPNKSKYTCSDFPKHYFYSGSHTSFVALQFAQDLGYKKIYLAGYDFRSCHKELHYYDKNYYPLTYGTWIDYKDKDLYDNYVKYKKEVLDIKYSQQYKDYETLQQKCYKKKIFVDSIKDYDSVEWTAEIINMNFASKLKKFKFLA